MKISLFNIVICVSVGLQLISCKQQTPQAVIDQYHRNGELDGSVLVVKNNKTVYDSALGFSNIEKGLKADKNTSFYIASLSKSFTAAAIIQLQEKGLLTYDDKASHYVELPEYAKDVSIRQLLNHTSGIKDYESLLSGKKALTNQDVIGWLKSLKKLEFASGSQFEYSNSGYIILSQIIQNISQKSYKEYITEHIIAPLQMNHTYVYDSSTVIENKALGYNQHKKPDDYSILTTGDGGIYSTPGDLYQYDQALRNFTLINKANTALMYTPAVLTNGETSNYGFGWYIENTGSGKVVSHTGGLNGFRALFWRDLQHNSCIIALTNQGDAFPLHDFLKDMKKAIQEN